MKLFKSKLFWVLAALIVLLFVGLMPVSVSGTMISTCPKDNPDCGNVKQGECYSFLNIYETKIFDYCGPTGFIWYSPW